VPGIARYTPNSITMRASQLSARFVGQQMTIQELGSLGEFVSAIAVFVTLIYLSIQTRMTRQAAEESAIFAHQEALRAVPGMYARYRALTSTPELAGVMVKARGDQELSETEKLLFTTIFQELIYTAATSYESSVVSASKHDRSGDVVFVLSVLAENPKAVDIWHQNSKIAGAISPTFVQTVNEALDLGESTSWVPESRDSSFEEASR